MHQGDDGQEWGDCDTENHNADCSECFWSKRSHCSVPGLILLQSQRFGCSKKDNAHGEQIFPDFYENLLRPKATEKYMKALQTSDVLGSCLVAIILPIALRKFSGFKMVPAF